jgi:hypothetical protein
MMKELALAMDSNNTARPKRAGYVLYRLAVIASLFFMVFSVFILFNVKNDAVRGMTICVDVVLFFFVRGQFKSRKLTKLAASMKVADFFEPVVADEQSMPAQKVYFGVDYKTGLIGIGSLYAAGFNKKKRLFFETDVIESYEQIGSNLTLNLRNREIPSMVITMLDGQKSYRQIEMACNMRAKYNANRGAQYQAVKAKMLSAGWMIDRDY